MHRGEPLRPQSSSVRGIVFFDVTDDDLEVFPRLNCGPSCPNQPDKALRVRRTLASRWDGDETDDAGIAFGAFTAATPVVCCFRRAPRCPLPHGQPLEADKSRAREPISRRPRRAPSGGGDALLRRVERSCSRRGAPQNGPAPACRRSRLRPGRPRTRRSAVQLVLATEM